MSDNFHVISDQQSLIRQMISLEIRLDETITIRQKLSMLRDNQCGENDLLVLVDKANWYHAFQDRTGSRRELLYFLLLSSGLRTDHFYISINRVENGSRKNR